MNPELSKKALEKIQNPNILINLVSRRVRQLNGGGPGSRPLIMETAGMGAADIALQEIVEDKLTYEFLEVNALSQLMEAEAAAAAVAAGGKKKKK